jgi:hypothetical protein
LLGAFGSACGSCGLWSKDWYVQMESGRGGSGFCWAAEGILFCYDLSLLYSVVNEVLTGVGHGFLKLGEVGGGISLRMVGRGLLGEVR